MHCNACRDARSADITKLLRKLQHAAVPTVLILFTTTTTTTRCRKRRASTTLLLLQLQCTAMPAVMPAVLLLHYLYDNYNTPCRATTTLLLRQLKHAAVPAVLLLLYYYYNYNALPCLP